MFFNLIQLVGILCLIFLPDVQYCNLKISHALGEYRRPVLWTLMSFLTSFIDIDEFSTESAHKAVRSYLPLTISVNKPVDWLIARRAM